MKTDPFLTKKLEELNTLIYCVIKELISFKVELRLNLISHFPFHVVEGEEPFAGLQDA